MIVSVVLKLVRSDGLQNRAERAAVMMAILTIVVGK